MTSDLGLLVVEQIIIHEVPQTSLTGETDGPVLSDVESPITPEIKGMLRARIIGGVGSRKQAVDIEWNPQSDSPVPDLIRDCFDSGLGFVEMSQQLANHLFESQPGISPAGLLAVIRCSLDRNTVLAILKIEREEGARLLEQMSSGKRTFDIQHLTDLILTPKTRLFKLAVFVRLPNAYEAVACDNQRSYSENRVLADFFLHFLGCKLAEAPNVATKNFYDTTARYLTDWFREDPETHALTYNHLVSALTSNIQSLSARQFAEDYLPPPARRPYLDYLKKHGVGDRVFDVDTSMITYRLRKTVYAFRSGASLIVPAEAAQKTVGLTNEKDGSVSVAFRDHLTDVKGK
ncbi:MAG: hypothetical protein EHM23_26905 [Acidobacteria bacterium]|nr:MAG: hypothetical protein EHM23_26905 [Acidobacteriota bacterium]